MDQTTSVPHKPGINWKFEFQQYGMAIFAAAVLFAVFSVYLYFRRGYYDLYIINKIFAGVAAVLLGYVLLLGPLNRMYNRFDRYLQYRKELGIVAAFLVFAHAVSSFFFLNDHFSKTRFVGSGYLPFMFGLLATAALFILVLVSNSLVMRRVGNKTWAAWQSWGIRLIFLFTALHVGIMKFPGWIAWYQGTASRKGIVHYEWPGAGLLVGWFIGFVILFRLADRINPKLGKTAWYLLVIGWPVVTVATFIVGRKYLP